MPTWRRPDDWAAEHDDFGSEITLLAPVRTHQLDNPGEGEVKEREGLAQFRRLGPFPESPAHGTRMPFGAPTGSRRPRVSPEWTRTRRETSDVGFRRSDLRDGEPTSVPHLKRDPYGEGFVDANRVDQSTPPSGVTTKSAWTGGTAAWLRAFSTLLLLIFHIVVVATIGWLVFVFPPGVGRTVSACDPFHHQSCRSSPDHDQRLSSDPQRHFEACG